MTESNSAVYRVIPKCACSTIGQIMYYSDHGTFFDGDIHDAKTGLHKWEQRDSQRPILTHVRKRSAFAFTCVRNPYTRILSSYFDKICGLQRNGRRYRGNELNRLIRDYDIDVGGKDGQQAFDQIVSFRRFVQFAHDTIFRKRPMHPDIHWSDTSGHASTFIVNGGRYDRIFWTERFNEGMSEVLAKIKTPHEVDLDRVPRFNKAEGHGPQRAHAVEDYFDDLTIHLVQEMYRRDFELFKYDSGNPANTMPVGQIDLEEVHAKLGR